MLEMLVDLAARPPPPEWGVELRTAAVGRLAERWAGGSMPAPRWDYPGLPPDLLPPEWYDYCGLAVSVVACLWPPAGADPWTVELDGTRLSDAPALFACFTRDRPTAGRLAGWSGSEAEAFFAGRGVLQLIRQRGERLREVATALLERWDGSFLHLVEEAGFDALTVVELLAATIPGYRDEVDTSEGLVRFDKLAHLATAMMSGRGRRPPFARLDVFPVYPDYLLPRVLRHQGILVYEPALAEAVDRRQPIEEGSTWEVAIRWATVTAGALLCAELGRRGNPVTGPRLDYRLWWEAVLGPNAARMGEHHRTVTLRY